MIFKKQQHFPRAAGTLLPISSLWSPYGIGTLGKAAFEFIDFLKSAGQSYWQVLPLCPTGYGDSPYQGFSAFAGNPYFIDLDILCKEGLLNEDDISHLKNSEYVDYGELYNTRFSVLRKAYSRSSHINDISYKEFCEDNRYWLDDYCLYMSIKQSFEGKNWSEWDTNIKFRREHSIRYYTIFLANEIEFWGFCQYKFFTQWQAVKNYANKLDIQIIGDIPIYVAMDSADIWVNPDIFQLDDTLSPKAVAGVPPDLFSADGQLWGNPLYDWEEIKKQDFKWWKKRIEHCAKIYDVLRIDHFIGIVNYFAIPAGDKTARNGKWEKTPKDDIINAINQSLGDKKVIAEDLGVVTDEVKDLIKESGYPGMKVMQFAFDGNSDNPYLTCNYPKNCTVYGGTHDNETLVGMLSSGENLTYIAEYFGVKTILEIPEAMIRWAYASVSDTVIFQIQDYLLLDNTARINMPSRLGNNWQWRVNPKLLTAEAAQKIYRLSEIYGRFHVKHSKVVEDENKMLYSKN